MGGGGGGGGGSGAGGGGVGAAHWQLSPAALARVNARLPQEVRRTPYAYALRPSQVLPLNYVQSVLLFKRNFYRVMERRTRKADLLEKLIY